MGTKVCLVCSSGQLGHGNKKNKNSAAATSFLVWPASLAAKSGADTLAFELLVKVARMRQQVVVVQRELDLEWQEGDDSEGQEENDQHGTVPAEVARLGREVLHDQLRVVNRAIWVCSLK